MGVPNSRGCEIPYDTGEVLYAQGSGLTSARPLQVGFAKADEVCSGMNRQLKNKNRYQKSYTQVLGVYIYLIHFSRSILSAISVWLRCSFLRPSTSAFHVWLPFSPTPSFPCSHAVSISYRKVWDSFRGCTV